MTDRVWISPTEPSRIKTLGESSSLPERFGVDVLWPGHEGMWGVQRKELSDFLSSRTDGRLEVELGQMKQLHTSVLILEGMLKWTSDGHLLDAWSNLTKRQLKGMLWTIRARGVWVDFTENVDDTVQTVRWLIDWSKKERHSGMRGRPGPDGSWGLVSDEDWGVHLLTSFKGIGVATARNIYRHFDGSVPIEWTVTKEELMEVDGVGEVRAKSLLKALS